MLERINEVAQVARRAINRLNNLVTRGVLKNLTTAKTPTVDITLLNNEKFQGVEFPQEFGFISFPPIDGTTEVVTIFFGGQRDHGTVLKSFNKNKALNLPLVEGESAVYNYVPNCYIRLMQDGTVFVKSDKKVLCEVLTNKIEIDGDVGEITVEAQSKVTVKTNEILPFLVGSSGVGTALNVQNINHIIVNDDGNITIKSDTRVFIDSPTILMSGHLYVVGDIIDKIETNPNNMREMRDIYDGHHHGGIFPGGDDTDIPNEPM